jgi:hypothetical protein
MLNASRDKNIRLQLVKDHAVKMGGSCEDLKYLGNKHKMSFICSKGHAFQHTFNKIFSRGEWCQVCVLDRQLFSINAIQEYVKNKGGTFTGEPKTVRSYIGLTCKDGHKWRTKVERLLYQSRWCPECAKSFKGDRLTIDVVKELAIKKNGLCISNNFVDRMQPLDFSCAEGHSWKTSAFAVFYAQSWCPCCAHDALRNNDEQKEIGLERLKNLAKSKSGRLISTEYSNINAKYDFECAEGHKWSTSGSNIALAKTWCPECAGKAGEMLTIDFVKKLTGFSFKKVRPRWLMGLFGKPLELDAFCEEQMFAIEYQGQQHYEFIPAWHKTEAYFKACQERDALKRKLCAEHGVMLFEVPFVLKPTAESIAEQVEKEARKACLPFTINPEFRAMLGLDGGKME